MSTFDEIKARVEAASPGLWRALSGAKQRSHEMHFGLSVSSAAFPMVLANNEFVLGELSAWTSDGDRALIVNARRDIEWLVNEVEFARGLLRRLYMEEEHAEGQAANYLATFCAEVK